MRNSADGLKTKSPDYYFKQGEEFETFVKQLFGEKFKVARHRRSKLLDRDTFISDIAYPDLEMIFQGKENYKFAVECKYRSSFKGNKIEWAKKEQIIIYESFQRKFAIPVFVAIGIGGQPSDPEHLFVTPLDNIRLFTGIHRSMLIPYKRKTTSRFFYDTVQLKLF